MGSKLRTSFVVERIRGEEGGGYCNIYTQPYANYLILF